MENPKDNILGKTEDIPATMRVESSTLEPITITDTHARFVFENKGILSRDTVLQFQLTQSGTDPAFLPIGCGIYSLIKRATLRVGAKRITEISDLAFYRTMTHAYNTPSYRANYLRFMKGINNTLVPTQVMSIFSVNSVILSIFISIYFFLDSSDNSSIETQLP